MTSFDFEAPLAEYLREEVAKVLLAKDIRCLDDLLDLIYTNGERWWHVVGLSDFFGNGVTKWLCDHEHLLGDVDLPANLKRRGSLLRPARKDIDYEDVAIANFDDVVNPETRHKRIASYDLYPHSVNSGASPMERIVVSKYYDGSEGSNRNRTEPASLTAKNDLQAIEAWLKAKATNNNTRSSYKKEAERFLLWAILEKQKPLSSLDLDECADYPRWLEMLGRVSDEEWNSQWKNPQSTWIGPKNVSRDSSNWRPFNSALGYSSRHTALTAVRLLFSFLHKTGYLATNPFDMVSAKVRLLPGEGKPHEFADRSLTKEQWAEILNYLKQQPDGIKKARLKVIFVLGKGLGMRCVEMLNARCGWIERRLVGNKEATMISIVGKGDKERRLPISDAQIQIINDYLKMRNELPIGQVPNSQVPILAALRISKESGWHLSRSGLYLILSDFLNQVALSIQGERPFDAAKLKASSTHWLRHTFAVRSLESMSVNMVQVALGHASVATTTRYLRPEESEIVEAMGNFAPI
ncbi:MAG: tyrosine-type recombinase/integrase, partial [Burkholderiales bacterium]|nr:tyrosine-type recombinase/integrase [Burkholderiales bacterium]